MIALELNDYSGQLRHRKMKTIFVPGNNPTNTHKTNEPGKNPTKLP
jgi:hypothetical protein